MDGCPRQNPAYRPATEEPRHGGALLRPRRRRPARGRAGRLSALCASASSTSTSSRGRGAPGAEQRLIEDALEQVELADRVGFDAVWEVEHHFLEEYSHSSASDVFLAAASQRTKRIRLGFGILPLPPGYQHPARVAETAAMLDLVSGGRVELGHGRDVERRRARGLRRRPRDQARAVGRGAGRRHADDGRGAVRRRRRALRDDAAAQRRAQAGAEAPPAAVGRLLAARDDPPGRAEGHRRAELLVRRARGGGASGSTSTTRSSPRRSCVPAGFAVNPRVAVVLPMMCARDEAEAIERGIDGAHFFGYSLAHYYVFGDHRPGRTDIYEEFLARRDEVGFARSVINADDGAARHQGAPARARLAARRDRHARPDPRPVPALRGGRRRPGDLLPAGRAQPPRAHLRVARAVRRGGPARSSPRAPTPPTPPRTSGSRGAVAAALARRPAAARGARRVRDRAGRLRPARRPEPRRAADARRGTGERPPRARGRRSQAAVQERGERAFQAFVRRSDDRRLERTAGSERGLRLLFGAMADAFEPDKALGFSGDLRYELRATDGTVRTWTVRIAGERGHRPARRRRPRGADPAPGPRRLRAHGRPRPRPGQGAAQRAPGPRGRLRAGRAPRRDVRAAVRHLTVTAWCARSGRTAGACRLRRRRANMCSS